MAASRRMRTRTEIAVTRVPQGNPGDPSKVPVGSPREPSSRPGRVCWGRRSTGPRVAERRPRTRRTFRRPKRPARDGTARARSRVSTMPRRTAIAPAAPFACGRGSHSCPQGGQVDAGKEEGEACRAAGKTARARRRGGFRAQPAAGEVDHTVRDAAVRPRESEALHAGVRAGLRRQYRGDRCHRRQHAPSRRSPTPIEALERAGRNLDRVASVFYNLDLAPTPTTSCWRSSASIAPRMAKHGMRVYQNAKLFRRVDASVQGARTGSA